MIDKAAGQPSWPSLHSKFGLLDVPDDDGDFGASLRPDVLAVLYAPSEGLPPQLWMRPGLTSQQQGAVLWASSVRLEQDRAGLAEAFLSFDITSDRRIALLYHVTDGLEMLDREVTEHGDDG